MQESDDRIPERMFRRERPVYDQFDDREMLYHRVTLATMGLDSTSAISNGTRIFANLKIPLPKTSVNRSWPDGEPDDVLRPCWPKFKDWGVLGFEVRLIPTPHIRDQGEALHYPVMHDPIDDNYYHCEIRAFREGESEPLKELKKGWKLWFRTELSQRLDRSNLFREPRV